jgi:hypothetical protein
MLYGVRKFELPALRARASWIGSRRSINARESAVIDVASNESHAPPPPPPHDLQDELAHESTDAGTDRTFRTVWFTDSPLVSESADTLDPIDADHSDNDIAVYEGAAESARISMPFGVEKKCKLPRASWAGHSRSHDYPKPTYRYRDVYIDGEVVNTDDTDDQDKVTVLTLRSCINLSEHGYYQSCNIKTEGVGQIKSHAHAEGLTQVTFANCVVKVRTGHDLDQLIALSNEGPVNIFNVQSNGWIQTDANPLPAFVLLRWMSSMSQ